MDQNLVRPDLLPATIPVVVLWVLALAGLAVWIAAHWFVKRRLRPVRPVYRLLMLLPFGTIASWLVLQALSRHLFLAVSWSLFLAAVISGLAFELVSALYAHEAACLSPRTARRVVALRMAALGLVLFVLLQPVLVGEKARTVRRRIVVLVDDSASMNFADHQWTDAERVDVASALGVIAPRPSPLRGFAAAVASASARLDGVRGVAADSAASKLFDRKDAAEAVASSLKLFRAASAAAGAAAHGLKGPARDELRGTLGRLKGQIDSAVLPALDRLSSAIGAGNMPGIASSSSSSVEAIAQIRAALPAVEDASDLASYDGFSAADRKRVLAASDVPRADIVRRLLARGGEKSFLGRSARDYDIEVFRFGRDALRDEALRDLVVPPAARARAKEEDAPKDKDAKAKSKDAGKGTSTTNAPAARSDAAVAEDFNGFDSVPASTNALPAAPDAATVKTAGLGGTREELFRSATDMTKSLETVLKEVPSEELASVIFFSDGRHTGEAGVDAIARKLGSLGVTISTVVVGGTVPPFDVSLASASCPESVFLGDKVRFTATAAATGAKGKHIKVRLVLDGKVIDRQEFDVDSDDWAKEIKFTHTPAKHGVFRYAIEIDPVAGELFPGNNDWNLDVSVSDDRTNVLLVDSRPRWEFRYLRNLFYGRDKSVNLQDFLLHPDSVAGPAADPLPLASASRPFGDSEAGGFPASLDEWRKFDVIILGDLGDADLPEEVVKNISYCVRERGALLVLIAGPEAMPFKINNPAMRELIPILYAPDSVSHRTPPEPEFSLALTPSGRGHSVMSQSSSSAENEDIWDDLPTFNWRIPVDGVKPGAEVLAYAQPKNAGATGEALARQIAVEADKDPDAAIKRLQRLREEQSRNALVVASSVGKGRVLMLDTDRMWRLRYKVGDTRHHRFWGQVLRWGAGEKLRAGNSFVRLGSDQLRYGVVEPVRIYARILDGHYNTIDGLRPTALLTDTDGNPIRRFFLEYRKDSNGFYEGVIPGITAPGIYRLVLECPKAAFLLGRGYPVGLETRFVVVTAKQPAEFVNVTASREAPARMAAASNGQVLRPSEYVTLSDDFGGGNKTMHDRIEYQLWCWPPIFVLVILVLAAEWILRKKAGVA